jgi:hypothetical protein
MADRKNPFIEIGAGEYKGIHRMPAALKDRAVTHEINRERVVASIMLDLHLMALVGIIKKDVPLSMSRAVSQTLRGTNEETTQAAHCAPRQIRIGTRIPQDILQEVFPERAWALKVLFGETDILPVNFNKCDSRVERNGLDKAFRDACQNIVDAALFDGHLETNVIMLKAERAFSIYKGKAIVSYHKSTERLREKLKPKFLFPKEKTNFTEQLQIIQQYADTLRQSPGKGEAISMNKIEGLIRIYKMI